MKNLYHYIYKHTFAFILGNFINKFIFHRMKHYPLTQDPLWIESKMISHFFKSVNYLLGTMVIINETNIYSLDFFKLFFTM